MRPAPRWRWTRSEAAPGDAAWPGATAAAAGAAAAPGRLRPRRPGPRPAARRRARPLGSRSPGAPRAGTWTGGEGSGRWLQGGDTERSRRRRALGTAGGLRGQGGGKEMRTAQPLAAAAAAAAAWLPPAAPTCHPEGPPRACAGRTLTPTHTHPCAPCARAAGLLQPLGHSRTPTSP